MYQTDHKRTRVPLHDNLRSSWIRAAVKPKGEMLLH